MSSDSDVDNVSLNSSELGTKNYWDTFYDKELKNYEDHSDIGDVWFGNAMLQRIIQWVDSNKAIGHEDPIIDLGCGNGWTLIRLARLGYVKLTGIDFSLKAIKLAESIAEAENYNDIVFKMYDLVDPDDSNKLDSFTLAVDKGTYDAISLSPEGSSIKRRKYRENVVNLIKNGGFFIISSCNWTEQELKDYFREYFSYTESIPPLKTFQFGGKTGNEYSTVVFQKKS